MRGERVDLTLRVDSTLRVADVLIYRFIALKSNTEYMYMHQVYLRVQRYKKKSLSTFWVTSENGCDVKHGHQTDLSFHGVMRFAIEKYRRSQLCRDVFRRHFVRHISSHMEGPVIVLRGF